MPADKVNFQREKTQKFRATSLCQEDDRTIRHIEEFGCCVVNLAQTNRGLGWSYTIGIFDTSGKPEMIAVGLPPETAHFALNATAELADLPLGWYAERSKFGEPRLRKKHISDDASQWGTRHGSDELVVG